MYLTEVKEWDIVKKQFRYKLKSYFGVFNSMMAIQLLAILFSFNGTGMSGGSSGTLDYEVHYFTNDIIQVFTMIWAFISAIITTTKAYRYDDYAFVTNHKVSHYSNFLFLFSASMFAGVTVYLSTHLFKVLTHMLVDQSSIMVDSMTITEFMTGTGASAMYIFLFATAGYFVGMLTQFNKIFSILLPVVFIGALILDGLTGNPTLLINAATFFGSETSFIFFLIKILGVSFIFLLGSMGISNRMEVSK
jgi:hypothetical protein